MLHGLPRGFQQQAVLRIDGGRLALAHTEELGIEAGNVVQERAPLRHRPTGHTGFGVVVLVSVPTVRGNLGDEVVAAQQRLPQLFGRIDAPRKSAAHSDDCNRSNWCLGHVRSSLLRPMSEPDRIRMRCTPAPVMGPQRGLWSTPATFRPAAQTAGVPTPRSKGSRGGAGRKGVHPPMLAPDVRSIGSLNWKFG